MRMRMCNVCMTASRAHAIQRALAHANVHAYSTQPQRYHNAITTRIDACTRTRKHEGIAHYTARKRTRTCTCSRTRIPMRKCIPPCLRACMGMWLHISMVDSRAHATERSHARENVHGTTTQPQRKHYAITTRIDECKRADTRASRMTPHANARA
jgi:hypothetical protein